jgi:AcrR family transcriptional regulator
MSKKGDDSNDVSTEFKIIEAAKKVFIQKGYKATLTREIAQEAGINLALLNYYFRKKELLFQIIVEKILEEFLDGLQIVFNDKTTSVEDKFLTQSKRYTSMLSDNPHLALFVLSELQIDPQGFVKVYKMDNLIVGTFFYTQLNDLFNQGKLKISPIQLLINFLSLVLFPFAGKAILTSTLALTERQYLEIIDERQSLVLTWLKLMIAE